MIGVGAFKNMLLYVTMNIIILLKKYFQQVNQFK